MPLLPPYTGARCAVPGSIATFSALKAATVELPTQGVRELKVRVHRVTPEGVSEALPVRVAVADGADVRRVDLAAQSGQIVVPLSGSMCRLELILDRPNV